MKNQCFTKANAKVIDLNNIKKELAGFSFPIKATYYQVFSADLLAA
jgi:hypothetical protein